MRIALRVSARTRSIRCRAHVQRASVAQRAAVALVCFCGAGAVLAAPAAVAAGPKSEVDTGEDPRVLRASPDPSRLLPGAVAAASGSPNAVGLGWAGYDGATREPLLGATAEARLGSRLVIGAGVTYATATSLQPGATRPSVMARLQILDQQRHGMDVGIALGYRQDRFVEEDGVFQASLAGAWRSERATMLVNVAYGQDGEGDDHEGEIRLAGFYRTYHPLHLGLDGRLRKLLDSTDPYLALHGTPSLEFTVGPVAALTVGGVWALLLETGVSGVRRGTLQMGAMVVGGVGAAF